MLTAEKYIDSSPVSIDIEAAAGDAMDRLSVAAEKVVVCVKDQRMHGLITPLSALRALRKAADGALHRAGDLVDPDFITVAADTPIDLLLGNLRDRGALMVEKEGQFCGVISLTGLTGKLFSAYEELERELDAIINFSSDEILVADGKGAVLRASLLFEEYFGVKADDVVGKMVNDLEKQKVFFPSVTLKVLDKRCPQTVIQTHQDGRTLLATGTPAFNPDGSVFRVIVNTRDITRLNKLKKQLEDAELLTNSYRQELNELRRSDLQGNEIVAFSPAMAELVKVVKKIAVFGSTVLLTGESGSGKGMIAKYIHSCSDRRNNAFSVVNCGAIPENLLESELFGYASGAFTGARREGKIGKLELANGGTLFLDEITELPLNLQVKLLHVLQEGKISRVGDTREIQLDLRFIAATNRDIVKMVEAGQFREDLFFRLDVIPLEVPPLSSRLEDLEALASVFLNRFNQKYHQHKRFSAEVIERLKSYRWPGNVRELENLIERMMIVIDDELIVPEHLPRHLFETAGKGDYQKDNIVVAPLRQARESLEKELLAAALKTCRTTYEMAKVLEIDQSTVVRKLKKYNLGDRS